MKAANTIPIINPKNTFLHFFLKTLISSDHKISLIDSTVKILSHFQILGLLISFPYEVLPDRHTDAFGRFTHIISQYICFKDIFNFSTKSALNEWIWIITILYIIFLILLTFIIVLYYHKKKSLDPLFLKIWTNIGTFHYSFAFLLIHQLLLSYLKYVHANDVVIFSPKDVRSFLVLGILGIIINIFYAGMFGRFLYDSVRNDSIYFSTRSNTHDLVILFLKLIDPPFSIFMKYYSLFQWIRIVVMILLLGLHVKIHYTYIPCYSYKPMRIYSAFSFIEVGIAIVTLLILILETIKGIDGLTIAYFMVIFVILLTKVSDVVLEKNIKLHSSRKASSIRSLNEFNWKLFTLEHIIETGMNPSSFLKHRKDHYNEYLFYAEILNHQKQCKNQTCGCNLIILTEKAALDNDPAKERQYLHGLRIELIKELYTAAVEKMPLLIELKIGLADIFFRAQSKSYVQAINLIHTINLGATRLEKRITAVLLLEKIENELRKEYDSSINVKEIVDYQALSEDLRQLIQDNIGRFLTFWENFKSPDPLLQKLYTSSIIINKEADKISRLWSQLINDFTKFSYQDHLLYGLYQSLARSAPHSAEKTLHKYFSFVNVYDPERAKESFVTSDNIHETSNILVCISMKREKLGMVTFVTGNIEEALQYNQSEILDKDIRMIMPPFFKERHRKIMIAHVDNNRNTVLTRNRQVFARRKNGFVVPYTVYVTMFPYFQEQLSYFGVLRPFKTFDEFILVLDNGTIDGFSENIGKLLNLKPEVSRKYQLNEISGQLAKVHRFLLQFVRVDGKQLKTLRSKKSFPKPSMYIGSTPSTNAFNSPVKNPGDRPSLRVTQTQTSYKLKESDTEVDTVGQRSVLRKATSLMDVNDLTKLYDIFTSTGVNIKYTKAADARFPNFTSDLIENVFNTVIIEEEVLGSHLRIFRLQPSTGEAISFDEDNDEEEPVLKNRPTDQTYDVPPENQVSLMNQTVEGLQTGYKGEEEAPSDSKVRLGTEEEINFRKPFSNEKLSAVFGQRPNELRIPKQKSASQLQVIKVPLPKRGSVRNLLLQKEASENQLDKIDSPKLTDTKDPHQRRRQSTVSIFHPQLRDTIYTFDNHTVTKGDQTRRMIESQKSEEFDSKNRQAGNRNLKNFLKENKIIVDINNANDDMIDRNSVSSQVKQNKVNAKLEHAIYLNEPDPTLKILTYVMVALCITSVGLLVVCKTTLDHQLLRIQSNIGVLQLSYERLNYVVEVNRRVRIIDMIQRGLAPAQRHTLDYAITNQRALLASGSNLLLLNNELRNSIYAIDAKYVFFELVPVIETDSSVQNRSENAFDVCTEIANSAYEIYNLLPEKPAITDPNLNFILNNTLNNLLATSIDATSIFLQDSKNHSNYIRNTIRASMVAIALLSVIIFIVIGRMEFMFKKNKFHFLETLMMIKDHEIDQWLVIVRSFHTTLKEGKRENRFIEYITNERRSFKAAKSAIVKKNQERAFKGRRAQFRGINMPIVYNLIAMFTLMVLFTLIFIILNQVFTTYDQAISETSSRVSTTKVYIFDFELLFTGLYEYITEKGQTDIINQPISTVWERIYANLSGFGYYLNTFIEADHSSELSYFLDGDLCSELFSNLSCRTDNSGVVSKGLIAMSGYMLNSMRGVKDFYDSSSMTTAAQQQALTANDFLNLENIFDKYGDTSFRELMEVLLQEFEDNVLSCKAKILVFVILASLCCFVLAKIVWTFVEGRMKSERENYRNMLRLIPVSVIISNRYVKQYLFTHSKKVLDLVKNKIY